MASRLWRRIGLLADAWLKIGSSVRIKVCRKLFHRSARMAELADALGSGPSSRKGVEVRVLFRAPNSLIYHLFPTL
jgi:hypothetical protein